MSEKLLSQLLEEVKVLTTKVSIMETTLLESKKRIDILDSNLTFLQNNIKKTDKSANHLMNLLKSDITNLKNDISSLEKFSQNRFGTLDNKLTLLQSNLTEINQTVDSIEKSNAEDVLGVLKTINRKLINHGNELLSTQNPTTVGN